MNTNMWGDFQISISVPLKLGFLKNNSKYNYNFVIYTVFSVLVKKYMLRTIQNPSVIGEFRLD